MLELPAHSGHAFLGYARGRCLGRRRKLSNKHISIREL